MTLPKFKEVSSPDAVEKISPPAPIVEKTGVDSTPSSRAVSSSFQQEQPPSYHDDSNLQEALERAQAKIRALSEELEDQKSTVSSISEKTSVSGTSVASQQRQAVGLPVSQTAVLVLIAFLVGWFFF